MNKWQNFFIQRMGTDSEGHNYPVFESVSNWGIWCKNIPFKVFEKVKEPAKTEWHDEHGDDEYIGSEGVYMEAYSIQIEFGCKITTDRDVDTMHSAIVNDVRERVGDFLEYLRLSGMMRIYSSHTRIGREYVRLEQIDDDATWKSNDNEEWLIFKVTLKVNDPITDWEVEE